MVEFTAERTEWIQAPIDEVYAYVSDFPRHVEWNHQPTEMTLMSTGPVGVGSVFRTYEQPPSNASWFMRAIWPVGKYLTGSKGYTEAEITALEPDHRVAWKAQAPLNNGGLMASTDWVIELESQNEGTKVTQRVDFRFFGKMGSRVNPETAAAQNGEEMSRNLARLKSILEAQTAGEKAASRKSIA